MSAEGAPAAQTFAQDGADAVALKEIISAEGAPSVL